MKILLLGSTGFIGSHLKAGFEGARHEVACPRVEVRNLSELEAAFQEAKPDAVVNATGVTGKPNVDWCEKNEPETFSVNVAGSINVATVAAAKGVYMVQIGSGCIYDGSAAVGGGSPNGYSETDEPNYTGSAYSRSRLLSEKALKEFPNVLQLRIRIPLLGQPHPKNLIDKLLLYPQMINRMNSCTVIEDFVPATLKLMDLKATGVFNMTNIGAMDHVSIMTLYKEIVDPNFKINVMPEAEQAALCARRSNCMLNTDKREALDAHMPPLEESLKTILEKYKTNKNKPLLG